MASPALRRSFKGNSAMWRGLVETSDQMPLGAGFAEMEDCVVGRDGTEIQPAPGTAVAGKPFYGQAFVVAGGGVSVGATATTITVDVTAEGDANAFLKDSFLVYVPADDATYIATRTAAAAFSIPTITSAIAAAGYVLVQRRSSVHDMATVDGKAAIVVETATWHGITTEFRNLATMVGSGPLSLTSVLKPGVPDETDAGFVMWPSPTMWAMNKSDYGSSVTAGVPYLRNYAILRRMQCDSINGRLVIAVPGLGIMFEANVRRVREWLPRSATTVTYQPNPRWTKMLGIPRGIMPNNALADSGAGSLTDGFYGVGVAYYDPYQDEVGLLSAVKAVEMAGGSSAMTVNVVMPRGAASETAGLQILVYYAGPYTTELEALQATVETFSVVGPFSTSLDLGAMSVALADYTVQFTITAMPSTLTPLRPRRVGVMEVPPPGASWARVVRGRMFCGGERPAYWDFFAWPTSQIPATSEPAEYFLVMPNEWAGDEYVYGPTALSHWQQSVGGRIVSEINSAAVANIGRVISVHNAVRDSSFGTPSRGFGPSTLKIDFNAGTTSNFNPPSHSLNDTKKYRILARQQGVKFSEEDHPGVAPAINELPVDSLADHATTGGARFADQLLLFTQHQTQLFGWASIPASAQAQVVSNTEGSVSAHGIAEGPFGVAWLSHKGPMVWAGAGIDWIGRNIQNTWATVLRDSEGMVPCAGACVDVERNLVIWAVRTVATGTWATATTDQLKAKVDADTLIIWNWVANSFSVVYRKGTRSFDCMRSMLYDDGTWRPTFASASGVFAIDTYFPLYGWSGWTDRGAATSVAITQRREAGSRVAVTGVANTDAYTGDYGFIRSRDGGTIRWFGRLDPPAGGVIAGESDAEADGADWLVGDVVTTRCARYQFKTHRLSMTGDGTDTLVRGVVIHASVTSGVYAYVRVRSIDENAVTTIAHPDDYRWGVRLKNGLNTISFRSRFSDGQLEFEVVADGKATIKDIFWMSD